MASRPIANVDALGNRTTIGFDAASRPVTTMNALGLYRRQFSTPRTDQWRRSILSGISADGIRLGQSLIESIDPLNNRSSTITTSPIVPSQALTRWRTRPRRFTWPPAGWLGTSTHWETSTQLYTTVPAESWPPWIRLIIGSSAESVGAICGAAQLGLDRRDSPSHLHLRSALPA